MSETKTTTEKIYVGSGKRVKDYDMINVTINYLKREKSSSLSMVETSMLNLM